MAYKKTNWQDTLRDAQGNVIQKGTPLNAQALGKIEDGIVQAEQKIDTEIQQVTTQLADIVTINVSDYITSDITQGVKNAIASAKDGDIIHFGDMDFVITSQITINKKVTLKGNGRIILGASGFDAFVLTKDGAVVDGLTFLNPNNYYHSDIAKFTTGFAIVVWANNCSVVNNTIDNYCGGIMFGRNGWGYKNCLIQGNKITNLVGIGTEFPNNGIQSLCLRAQIVNNSVEVKTGTFARSCIGVDLDGDYSIVSGNRVVGNSSCKTGIHVESSPNTIISNNIILSPKWQGITTSDYCMIVNNWIETSSVYDSSYQLTQSGIYALSTTHLTIEGNTIVCKLPQGVGVRMGSGKNHLIVNNKFLGDAQQIKYGIQTHVITYSKIIGNTFEKSLCIDAAIRADAKQNIFSHNHIEGGKYGIDIRTSDNSIISDNVIKNTTEYGIYSYDNSNVIIKNNQIIDDQTIRTQKFGIRVTNPSGVKPQYVLDNLFIGNVTGEVELGSNTGSVVIRNIGA